MKKKRPQEQQSPSREGRFDYDICLSFAGEDRDYVHRTATALRKAGIRVFYDQYEEAELWGKDLYAHLHEVYSNSARYCVIFISKHYARKLWSNHERVAAQERAFRENREYILPARFDQTAVPGLPGTIGYVALRDRTPSILAKLIRKKLGPRQRERYLPPIPNRLLASLRPKNERQKANFLVGMRSFFEALQRMTRDERHVLFNIFIHGCPAELPDNIHINIDLLRRYAGIPPARIRKLMGQITSLGIDAEMREDDETEGGMGKKELLVVRFLIFSTEYDESKEMGTAIANKMIQLTTDAYCEEHGLEALHRLDFHQLASSTFELHAHGVKPRRIRKNDLKLLKASAAKKHR